MMWKHRLEEIEQTLIDKPGRPWAVKVNVWDNSHQIRSTDDKVLISIPIPPRGEVETEEEHGARISEQWNMLNFLVDFANQAEFWFNEMRAAGINDIKTPVRPKPKIEKKHVAGPLPEPVTFKMEAGMFKREKNK